MANIKELISQIRTGYDDAGIDQLEIWLGQLSTEFAWICEQLAEIKRDKAAKEFHIKQQELLNNSKITESEVQRIWLMTEHGKYYSYASEILKAISKLITACRFKAEALRGKI